MESAVVRSIVVNGVLDFFWRKLRMAGEGPDSLSSLSPFTYAYLPSLSRQILHPTFLRQALPPPQTTPSHSTFNQRLSPILAHISHFSKTEMLPVILFIIALRFLGVLRDAPTGRPSPVTHHDSAISHLFSQIYSIAGQVAPTDPATLNQTRTEILSLLSSFHSKREITSRTHTDRLYCETSLASPQYADVASAMSQLYRRAGEPCNRNFGCEAVQMWGSAEIGVCGPFGYSWDCKDVGGMAFWIAAKCKSDLGVTRVGGRYQFDRWWTQSPADVRIYRRL